MFLTVQQETKSTKNERSVLGKASQELRRSREIPIKPLTLEKSKEKTNEALNIIVDSDAKN